MLRMFRKIYEMAEGRKKLINISLLLHFVDSSLSFVPVGCVMLFYQAYITNTLTPNFHLQIFGMLVLGVVLRIFTRYYMDKNQYTVMYQVFYNERIKVADHLKKVNMGFFTDDNIGKVSTTLTNGIGFIEEHGTMATIEAITSIVSLIVIFTMLCIMDMTVAIIFAITVAITLVMLISYNKKTMASAVVMNKATEDLTGAMVEYVRNISVIKAFDLIGKHDRSNDAFTNRRKADLDSEKLNIPYIVSALVFMALGTSAIIYYILTTYDTNPAYNIIMISIFSMYVFRALEVLVLKIAQFNIACDSLDKIEDLYKQQILQEKNNQIPTSYDIEFENVKFAYDTKSVIDEMSFKLEENTMNALVGLSGSGKSTLVNLIPRFFDINEGSIKIGGVDIRDMSTETLYDSISMVFQNVYLFKDTIYNNIVFGNESATKEEVIDACKKANCYDFINKLEDGFDTVVGEAGLTLSGGERQRISIARAMLKNAPIILLDEATASVDPDNELEIQEAINALVENKTILVIAHKLSCVKNADKILVINDGKLIEEGTHDELIKSESLYSSLWQKRMRSKSWKIAN